MKRTGLMFCVEGEFVEEGNWQDRDDPAAEEWEIFSNEDIHSFGKQRFIAWSQFNKISEKDKTKLIDEIVTVIDWLQRELDWFGFCASLWLDHGKEKPECVFKWELC